MVDQIVASLSKFSGSVKVRSVANPALWFFAVSVASYTSVVIAGREPPLPLTIAVYAGTILVFASVIWFSVRDPDRLQSEDYRLHQQALKMVADKGTRQQKTNIAKVRLETKPFPKSE